MFNLAEYRNKPQSLADFLPWAALVAEGVILNKDGSLQRTARFRGPDLDSATPAELVGRDRATQQRAAAARLGLGDLRRSEPPLRPGLPGSAIPGSGGIAWRRPTWRPGRGTGRPFRERRV